MKSLVEQKEVLFFSSSLNETPQYPTYSLVHPPPVTTRHIDEAHHLQPSMVEPHRASQNKKNDISETDVVSGLWSCNDRE